MDSFASAGEKTSASVVVVVVEVGAVDGGSGSGDIGFLPTPVGVDLIWPGMSGTLE